MTLQSLTLTNFRGIRDLSLDFSDRVNVLAGVNGAGKTAILDCTAIMLSRLIGRVRSNHGTGRSFTEHDISRGASATQNEVVVTYHGDSFQWSIAKARKGRFGTAMTRLEELSGLTDLIRSRLDDGGQSDNVPVMVYYPVNRAVLDIPLRIRTRHQFDQLAAYDQALSGDRSNFRTFFEWFRDREDLENEQRIEDRMYRDRQLAAVRRAIEQFLTGFTGLKVKRSPLRMVVLKKGEELIVNQLSDGEKCTLAMVGDLARRMAIANPSSEEPLRGDGIVLIDEIDLHLHPGWQRQVVTALQVTFPNCQFIVSTHSPQIVSHVTQERIWILERTETEVTASRPSESFGQTTGRILEDIMGVPERPQEIKDRLRNLFLAIREDRLETAAALLVELRDAIGADPDLTKADIHIRRREALSAR